MSGLLIALAPQYRRVAAGSVPSGVRSEVASYHTQAGHALTLGGTHLLPRPRQHASRPHQQLSRPGQSRAKRDEEHAWCPGLAISTGSGHARRPGYTVLGRGLHQRPLCTELHVVRCRRLAIDLALLFDRREGCPECAIAAAAKLTRRTVVSSMLRTG